MKNTANEIWSEYLDTSSMTQINVDSKARSHCKEALQNPNDEMFEKAQTHVKIINFFFNSMILFR